MADDALVLAKEQLQAENESKDKLVSIDKGIGTVVSQVTTLNKNMNNFLRDMSLRFLQQKDTADTAASVRGEPRETSSESGFGKLLAALVRSLPALIAGVMGAVAGAVLAQLRAVGFFSKLLGGPQLAALAASIADDLKVRFFVIFDDLRKSLATKLRPLVNVIDDIGVRIFVIFDDIRKSISTRFARIASAADDLGKSKFVTNMTNFLTRLKNLGSFVLGPFVIGLTEVGKILSPIANFFTSAATGTFGKVMGTIRAGFGQVVSVFSRMGAVFQGLAATVGKIFLPITIVMTLIDTVKESMSGFEQEGFIGGVKGAITGLINSLIFMPIDLLKDLVSWALKKLGFEEASKKLDSFSFSDMFSDFIDFLFDLPSRLLSALLPDPTSVVGRMLANTDTGKGLYNFARVDMETGERAELVTRSSMRRAEASEELTDENRSATAMKMEAEGKMGGMNVVDASTSNQSVTNNNQAISMTPPSASNPIDTGGRGLYIPGFI